MKRLLTIASFLLASATAFVADSFAANGAIDRIDQYCREFLKKSAYPGFSIVVVSNDRTVFVSGYGIESITTLRPMTPDSGIGIGSLTKSFTAMAVLQLSEKGLIGLDDPVVKYLPWFKTADETKSKRITVRMLLNNTSGLPSLDDWMSDMDQSDAAIERLVKKLSKYIMKREPGEGFEYANEGWCVLGLVIAKVSGMPYRTYMQEMVLKPLGMDHSSTDPALIKKLFPGDNFIIGHYPGINGCFPGQYTFVAAAMPAGSCFRSTASDMGHYLIALLNGGVYKNSRVLREDTVRAMWTPAVSFPSMLPADMGGSDKDWHYAMGWMTAELEGKPLVMHGGDTMVSSSLALIYPDKKVAVCVLFNADLGGDPYRYPVRESLCNNVLRLLLGLPLSDFGVPKKSNPDLREKFVSLPPSSLSNYTGSYFCGEGFLEIYFGHGGNLEMMFDMGIMKKKKELRFIDETRAVAIGVDGTMKIGFTVTSGGNVTACTAMGRTIQKKDAAILEGYHLVGGPGGIRFPLPDYWKGAWADGIFRASSTNGAGEITLEFAGDGAVRMAGLTNGARLLYAGDDITESKSGVLWTEKTLFLEEGKATNQYFAAYADIGDRKVFALVKAPFGRISETMTEVLRPMLDCGWK